MTTTHKKIVDEKRWAEIVVEDDNPNMVTLVVCNNGYQSCGVTMFSREVVEAAYHVLGQYLEVTKDE